MKNIHNKEMDNFKNIVDLLQLSVEQQLETLNNAYNGEVTFCIEQPTGSLTGFFMDIEDDDNPKDIICIKSINIIDECVRLILPNCDSIDYRWLYSSDCTQTANRISIPYNDRNKKIIISRIDTHIDKKQSILLDKRTKIICDLDTSKIESREVPNVWVFSDDGIEKPINLRRYTLDYKTYHKL